MAHLLQGSGLLLLQSLEIARAGLVQQFLQGTTVIQTATYFRHQLLGNVKTNAAPLEATVENIAGVLFPGKTGTAVLAHARAAAEAQGAEGGGPEVGSLLPQPGLDLKRRFGLRSHHVCMPQRYIQVKNIIEMQ
jgi:hypothetical protein